MLGWGEFRAWFRGSLRFWFSGRQSLVFTFCVQESVDVKVQSFGRSGHRIFKILEGLGLRSIGFRLLSISRKVDVDCSLLRFRTTQKPVRFNSSPYTPAVNCKPCSAGIITGAINPKPTIVDTCLAWRVLQQAPTSSSSSSRSRVVVVVVYL